LAIDHAIHEGTFIELVLDAASRRELLELVNGRDRRRLGLRELVSVVAPKCEASPDQLRDAITSLDDDAGADLASDLLFHPKMPTDVLLRFATEGKHLASIAHRAGTPREVLEVLAEKHRYPEAITTLAIDHYGAPTAKAKAFRDFIARFEDVPMLEYNLRRATLDDAKRRAVVEVFG
jgi:hypothetical protein